MLGLADQAVQIILPVYVIGGGAKKIVLAKPGKKTAAHHIGPPGDLVPARLPHQPVADQIARLSSGVVAAERAKVAEPVKAVQLSQPGLVHAARPPGPQAAPHSLAEKTELTTDNCRAAIGVARPGVGRNQGQVAGRAA